MPALLRSPLPALRRSDRHLARTLVLVLCASFAAIACGARPAAASPRLGPGLARAAAVRPDEPVAVWVFFTDRAGREHDPAAFETARRALPARALERRLRRGSLPDLVASDLPVYEPYVRTLVARGARLRGTSRWLNAASVEVTPRLAAELARLPFVDHAELVEVGRRNEPVGAPEPVPSPNGVPPRASASATTLSPGDTAYYGGSFKQLDMMQVPALHALGLSGAGVLVCMLDTGFHLTHQAFAGLQVIAARDFIHGDTNVDDEPGQDIAGQMSHGTMTLGCVAGSEPGTFSGVAYGATVALGKTENIASETPVEMDYWQFGAEWADSLGADVISSSLGYATFDPPYPSYTFADLNGHTTVVTLAALEAARRGITVVTAAGNENGSSWNHIIAPADADSVITSGAVDSFNVVAYFSSRGPTYDGRTKPDVTAMGVRVLSVNPNDNAGYVRASGTSFSTPLTAGLAALLIEAHPWWRPFEVREALRGTALNHATPNNDIGWGLVQGLAADSWVPSSISTGPEIAARGLQLAAGPNPVRPGAGTTIRFSAPDAGGVTLDVLDISGRECARLYDGPARSPQSVRWSGRSDSGRAMSAGVYWLRLAERDAPRPGTRTMRVVLVP